MDFKRDQDFFWEGVDRGELLAQKCGGCGTLRHPPMPRCAQCGSDLWDAEHLSGKGTIMAAIESAHPSRREDAPRCVALIDLEEGLRMVSNILDPENAANGVAVALEFGEDDGHRLPMFRTVGGER